MDSLASANCRNKKAKRVLPFSITVLFFQITVPFWKFMRSRGELLIFFLILCHNFEIFRVPAANYWYFSHKHGTIFQKYAVFFFRMLLPSLAGHHFSKTLNYFSQMPHFCLKYAVIFPKCPFPISGTALFFRNAAFWFKMRHFFLKAVQKALRHI